MTFTLRPYQFEAENALDKHLCTKETNPCIVLPTGSGKSVVMASVVRKWHTEAPHVRGCILAHRKELVMQNAEKLMALYPEGNIGIFSAGLGRRDYTSQILFASIDSVYKRAGDFPPFDFIFVDEAHRIPPSGEGKYRTFITGCKRFNQRLRVAGWTATPFRMGCGPICHKDHILNEVCYEAKITDLIRKGFLCNLRSKVGVQGYDLREVSRNHGGDYKIKSLAFQTNKDTVVEAAIEEAARIIGIEHRRACIFFCVDIEHCKKVSVVLQRHRIYAPYITGKTKRKDRDALIKRFKARRLQGICCVNVLTEGFDAPHIDCIVLLRPTLSPGLFSQMVGRGLRISSDKKDCLVLDFAGCIEEHGPIDLLGGRQKVVMACCPMCRESFSRVIGACPNCGWEIPKQEIERLEAVERKRRMHGKEASKKSILSTQPRILKVDAVTILRHRKDGSPDSLKVQYRCGLTAINEWICLDHDGIAGKIAKEWWSKRGLTWPPSVNHALEDMFTAQTIKDYTRTITVRKNGKYNEIVGYNQPVEEENKKNEST
jgi:DNA repair protein RadD